MTGKITVVRSPEFRAMRWKVDVLIDGVTVGTLKRGGQLTHQMPDGDHQLQAVVDQNKKSPRRKVTIGAEGGEDGATYYVSVISERAAFVRSPTKAADWLVLTTDGSVNNANGATTAATETRLRLALTVAVLAVFVVNQVAPRGSTLKQATYLLWIGGGLVLGVLIVRHFRHLYRSPR